MFILFNPVSCVVSKLQQINSKNLVCLNIVTVANDLSKHVFWSFSFSNSTWLIALAVSQVVVKTIRPN